MHGGVKIFALSIVILAVRAQVTCERTKVAVLYCHAL